MTFEEFDEMQRNMRRQLEHLRLIEECLHRVDVKCREIMMAVKDGTYSGRDRAHIERTGSTTNVRNDQYDGRCTDEKLSSSDGHRLEDRDEWNYARVWRRREREE